MVRYNFKTNEVTSANAAELEGLKRSMDVIGRGHIKKFVTDRHRGVAKWLRENMSSVMHRFDIWHIAKGILCQPLTSVKFECFYLC